MADVTITLMGERQLRHLLKNIPKKYAQKALRKATRAGCKVIAPMAKRLAPKKTGLVKRAIRVRAMKRSRSRVGCIVLIGEKNFAGKSFYGGFQEFGWQAGSKWIEGQHFMERAAKNKQKAAGLVAATTMRRELAQIPRVS